MSLLVIYTREQRLVNTDPQRRCYWGVNAKEELQWTAWSVLESMKFLKPGADPQARLKFWQDINAYSVSVGGTKREYKLGDEAEVPEELAGAARRYFKVLDASGIAFNRIKNGMVLEYIRDLPELGQVLLKQPQNGTVGIDYAHVQEVTGGAS